MRVESKSRQRLGQLVPRIEGTIIFSILALGKEVYAQTFNWENPTSRGTPSPSINGTVSGISTMFSGYLSNKLLTFVLSLEDWKRLVSWIANRGLSNHAVCSNMPIVFWKDHGEPLIKPTYKGSAYISWWPESIMGLPPGVKWKKPCCKSGMLIFKKHN